MIRTPLWAALLFAASASAATVGQPAPALAGTDAGGAAVKLADLRGRVVYLDFWASWCAPCLQALPHYQSLARELEPRGLTVIGVNLDRDRALADRALKRTGASFPVVFDPAGRWAQAFALPAMPTSYVIDRSGTIRHVQSGFRAGDEAAIRAAIEAALKETP